MPTEAQRLSSVKGEAEYPRQTPQRDEDGGASYLRNAERSQIEAADGADSWRSH